MNTLPRVSTRLIGLGGYACVGKDETARVLARNGWSTTYMSEPLERALLALNPYVLMPGQEIYDAQRYSAIHAQVGYDASKKIPEVRRLLQALGTEVGRNILGPDVWVDAMIRTVRSRPTQNWAVSGIRFPNELAAIKRNAGVTVWVTRPGYGPVNGHPSDNTLSEIDFDLTLENSGTLEDLAQTVERIFL